MKTQLMVFAAVLALSACGPRAQISGGKQGASEALYAASGPLKGGSDRYGSKIDVTGAITVNCAQGGTVSLNGFGLVLTGSFTDIKQSFNADYNNCGVMTASGVASMTGRLAVVQAIAVNSGTVDLDQTIKGKLAWSGACDDFLELDVSQKVTAAALSQTSGGVSMVVKGSVKDTEGTYSFDEAVSVTPGKVSVVVSADKK